MRLANPLTWDSKGSFKGSFNGSWNGSFQGSFKGPFQGSFKGSFEGSMRVPLQPRLWAPFCGLYGLGFIESFRKL